MEAELLPAQQKFVDDELLDFVRKMSPGQRKQVLEILEKHMQLPAKKHMQLPANIKLDGEEWTVQNLIDDANLSTRIFNALGPDRLVQLEFVLREKIKDDMHRALRSHIGEGRFRFNLGPHALNATTADE